MKELTDLVTTKKVKKLVSLVLVPAIYLFTTVPCKSPLCKAHKDNYSLFLYNLLFGENCSNTFISNYSQVVRVFSCNINLQSVSLV